MILGRPRTKIELLCDCKGERAGHESISLVMCLVPVTLVKKKAPEPFEPGRFEIDDELREPMDEAGCFRRVKAETA